MLILPFASAKYTLRLQLPGKSMRKMARNWKYESEPILFFDFVLFLWEAKAPHILIPSHEMRSYIPAAGISK